MPRLSGPQDYRPVALTSHVVKTLERLILEQLPPIVRPHQDLLLFAYQPHLGTEDTIIYQLCLCPSGRAGEYCEDHLFRFFQCIQ